MPTTEEVLTWRAGSAQQRTSGPEISSDEHEVVLHAEEPVADKRVVPKERVRLDKDVHIDEHTVSEEVRREQIEIDDAGGRSDRA
jgi:stress response protein YsnF